MTNNNKRIALVTGGMGGIGTAISQRLYRDGFIVVVGCSTQSTRKEAWLEQQRQEGYEFHCMTSDITDWNDTVRAFAQVREEVGQIDVLVNNAGITRDTTFKRMTPEDWNAVISTNLNGLFNTSGRHPYDPRVSGSPDASQLRAGEGGPLPWAARRRLHPALHGRPRRPRRGPHAVRPSPDRALLRRGPAP